MPAPPLNCPPPLPSLTYPPRERERERARHREGRSHWSGGVAPGEPRLDTTPSALRGDAPTPIKSADFVVERQLLLRLLYVTVGSMQTPIVFPPPGPCY